MYKMGKLAAIGEAIVDFIPDEAGKGISQVKSFSPNVGGAPANVCGAFSKLGGKSFMITQVGQDPFGDKVINELKGAGVDCSHIRRTDRANTSLSFVALREDGNREFMFYRKPGADMLFLPEYLTREEFENVYCLHFCSVSLGKFPMKDAHLKAVGFASDLGSIISFDPNIRTNLWENTDDLKIAVDEFIPKADILKVSDEEIEFITGKTDIEDALPFLFKGHVKLVLYTCGSKGSYAFTKEEKAFSPSLGARAVDTTGAGDAFIGSFLYVLCRENISRDQLGSLEKSQLERFMAFSNKFCGMSIQKKGAIASYPDIHEMEEN